jgi:uncharacterized protein (TIGR01777 family)
MKKVIIAGGTGFLGMGIAASLAQNGYHPILMARNPPKQSTNFEFVQWDAVNVGDWIDSLENAFAVINLAGKSVNCIKTPDNCDLILRSRVDSTLALGEAVAALKHPPSVWIQMSTAHIYGDPPKQICDEHSSLGYGLAPVVGKAWEKAFWTSLPEQMRGVVLRTSFVLGKSGGALPTLKRIAQFGFGGPVGSGKQGMSWIHEKDMYAIIQRALEDESYKGCYVASAPYPVSNMEFMKTLRKSIKMPFGLASPTILTKLGAKLFLNTDPELALYGRFVRSKRIDPKSFRFPNLEEALQDIIINK